MTNLLRSGALLRLLPILALSGMVVVPTAHAGDLVVTTTDDVINSSDGLLSLREAVIAANAANGPKKIVLPAGTYVLTLSGADEDAALTGDLDLTGHVTIQGAGPAATIVDGGGLDRVFHVLPGADAAISGLTVQGGVAAIGGGIAVDGAAITLTECCVTHCGFESNSSTGGGIAGYSNAIVTIKNSTITHNTLTSPGVAIRRGGGIAIYYGELTVQNSTVAENDVGHVGIGYFYHQGGGIYAEFAVVNILNTELSDNSARSGSGLFMDNCESHIQGSAIANNYAAQSGAGIYSRYSSLVMRGCTVSGNSANPAASGRGGAMFIDPSGDITIQDCSFLNNTAPSGAGIYEDTDRGSLTISDSTFTANSAFVTYFGYPAPGTGVGGAIYVNDGSATIRHSTIMENSAGQAAGGIYFAGPFSLTIRDSIVLNNTANVGGDLVAYGVVELIDSVIGDIAP
jgi:hypothetical protein